MNDKAKALYAQANKADDAWQAQLIATFGLSKAADARYTPAGKGQPGSALRAAYEEWSEAIEAYSAYYDAQYNDQEGDATP